MTLSYGMINYQEGQLIKYLIKNHQAIALFHLEIKLK